MRESLHDPEFDPWPAPAADKKAALRGKAADKESASSGEDIVSISAELGALLFAAIIWMLTTLIVAARASHVGWPGLLSDACVLVLTPVPLSMLLLLVLKWREIPGLVGRRWCGLLEGVSDRCPGCGAAARPGPFRRLGLLLAVVLSSLGLPGRLLGLLVLFVIRVFLRDTTCIKCADSERF